MFFLLALTRAFLSSDTFSTNRIGVTGGCTSHRNQPALSPLFTVPVGDNNTLYTRFTPN